MNTTDEDWYRLLAAAGHPGHTGAPVPSTSAVMTLASNLGSEIDPDSIGCSITMVDGDGYVTPAASNPHALGLDAAQYRFNEGPCVAAARTGDWHDIELIGAEQRWPHFVRTAVEHGVGSSLSVPLLVPHRPAALNIYSARERAFVDGHKRAVVGFLARCLSSALTTLGDGSERTSEPPGLRDSEARGQIVARAVAALQAQRGGSQQAGFRALANLAQKRAQPLLAIAEEVLAEAGPLTAPAVRTSAPRSSTAEFRSDAASDTGTSDREASGARNADDGVGETSR